MELSDIKINIDFENLIPKQTVEQFKQLEENILKEGRARNPLVVWKDHGILVDGHHRLRILKANPSIEYSVIEQAFSDEEEVKEWIIKNALGTRNLTDAQIYDLRGRLFNMRKGRRGATKGYARAERDESGKFTVKSEKATSRSGDVAQSVANELGINRNTVFEAANFVDGLDAADAVVPGFKDAVLTGEVKAQKQEVAAMRKQTPDEIKKSVETIKERKGKRNPSDKDITKKIREMDAVMSGVSTPQYGLAELIREIDTATDSFIATLSATLRRRKNVIASYDGSEAEIITCIDNAIEKLNEMKKEFEK